MIREWVAGKYVPLLCRRLAQATSRWLAFVLWGAGTIGTQALTQDGWHDAAVASEPVHTQPRAP
jgi:hypothetical protein